MALNLMTLTRVWGGKVEVNPAHIVLVEGAEKSSQVTLSTGDKLTVVDQQAKIREVANRRPPDGN